MNIRRWSVPLGVLALLGLAVAAWAMFREPKPGALVAEPDFTVWKASEADSDQAHVTFEIVNSGGTPVRIRAVESGCDCAVPKIDPELIPPGGSGVVEVEAEPPESGERVVRVRLLTDSTVTPEVPLYLRMVGASSEARLGRVGGELGFVGDWSPAEIRSLRAKVWEPAGESRPPFVESNLPFLGFTFSHTTERPTADPPFILRTYVYQVRFRESPPPGRFEGEIRVRDPHDLKRVNRLRVYGEMPKPLEVVPARLQLNVSAAGQSPEAELRLVSRNPDLDPTIEPASDGGHANPLTVRAIPSENSANEDDDEGARFAFVVGLSDDPEQVEPGDYELIVHPSPSAEPIRVPVRIRREEDS